MLHSSVTTKGQVTIPIELRHKLGIAAGDRMAFIEVNGNLMLQKTETDISSVFALVKSNKNVSLEDMEQAINNGKNRHVSP